MAGIIFFAVAPVVLGLVAIIIGCMNIGNTGTGGTPTMPHVDSWYAQPYNENIGEKHEPAPPKQDEHFIEKVSYVEAMKHIWG